MQRQPLSTNNPFLNYKICSMKLKILIAAILLPLFSISQSVKLLHIGDKVPDIDFSHVINYQASHIKLSDLKEKPVILDFWATTCMSCIYHMPLADSLQARFGDSIQILLVNPLISRDSLPRVRSMLQRFIAARGIVIHIPIVLYDTAAFACFPFQFLPHYVWLGSDGRLKAITGAEEFTEKNISALLHKKPLCLPLKSE
jgi:thiol-disulfide isomerase/thioredoxin